MKDRIDFDIVLFCYACWVLIDIQARFDAVDAEYVNAVRGSGT